MLLKMGEHLGDPVDYSAYVIASLTRDSLDPAMATNFNLDSDRGYAYLCWDWLRAADNQRVSRPKGFVGLGDPSDGGAPTPVSEHHYPSPVEPGYGWDPTEQFAPPNVPPPPGFDPFDPNAEVRIRYIDRQAKF
jgi:hypothetical protein